MPTSPEQEIPCEVLGIGTPIVDQTLFVNTGKIENIGGMQLVDHETFLNIVKQADRSPVSSIGGSALNTIRGLALLGHSCAFFGKIGSDLLGTRISAQLDSLNIRSHLLTADLPTAQVACLITPDSERTMRSFLGAGASITPEDLTPALFKEVKLVHIEGYLLTCKGVVSRAMELAKQAGAQISFDLANFEIVTRYKAEIAHLLATYVQIVFANAEEASLLSGLTPERSCSVLRDLTNIAIVKMGEKGGWISFQELNFYYPAVKVEAVDSTGAGDFFASGFLHGYLQNKILSECARIGAFVASEVVKVVGTEISPEVWKKINL